jgi:ATP-dependent Clp protease adaptor protein ClpS
MSIDFDKLFDDQEEIAVLEEREAITSSFLIVLNDDHNTFDWVIECLMTICDCTFEQAEQLSLLVHYKGKATVKEGGFEKLRPLKDALCERGLSAIIETEVKS